MNVLSTLHAGGEKEARIHTSERDEFITSGPTNIRRRLLSPWILEEISGSVVRVLNQDGTILMANCVLM